jgi:ElaB/YqjD/DUF883 family membrane-anchored ribosome-binding protein
MEINAQALQNQWELFRRQLKERWAQLTDEDLWIHDGDVDQLVSRLQQKTGEGREAIERFLNDLIARASSALSRSAETAGEYAHEASDLIRESCGEAAGQARERFRRAQDVIRRNPIEAVAVAFGVGLIFGLALRRQ